ncbi:MAG: AarF/UbiB family protein [Desulfobaccales bacterium]
MAFPVASDYSEELQNPKFCLKDGTLQNCAVTTDQLGLPRLITGNVAAVCRLQCGRKSWAIRCFCREVPDIEEHYHIIGDYLKNNRLPEFVDFEYQPEGIKVKGSRYPILKMEWVEGDPLHVYVGNHLRKPKILAGLAEQCRQVVAAMRSHKMAHGDLQHGNIMVTQGGKIKLVDYDGMYVHKHKNKKGLERGHPNYQHPQRSGDNFNENLDNFSAILIYLSLLALAQEPRLWKEFHNEDNLILTGNDLKNPKYSRAMDRLKNSAQAQVRHLVGVLEECCLKPISMVPDLEAALARPSALAVPPPVSGPSALPAHIPTQPTTPLHLPPPVVSRSAPVASAAGQQLRKAAICASAVSLTSGVVFFSFFKNFSYILLVPLGLLTGLSILVWWEPSLHFFAQKGVNRKNTILTAAKIMALPGVLLAVLSVVHGRVYAPPSVVTTVPRPAPITTLKPTVPPPSPAPTVVAPPPVQPTPPPGPTIPPSRLGGPVAEPPSAPKPPAPRRAARRPAQAPKHLAQPVAPSPSPPAPQAPAQPADPRKLQFKFGRPEVIQIKPPP